VKVDSFSEIKNEGLEGEDEDIFFNKFEEVKEGVEEVVIIGVNIINFVNRGRLIIEIFEGAGENMNEVNKVF
jgi:hypothetical protein